MASHCNSLHPVPQAGPGPITLVKAKLAGTMHKKVALTSLIARKLSKERLKWFYASIEGEKHLSAIACILQHAKIYSESLECLETAIGVIYQQFFECFLEIMRLLRKF